MRDYEQPSQIEASDWLINKAFDLCDSAFSDIWEANPENPEIDGPEYNAALEKHWSNNSNHFMQKAVNYV